MESPVAAPACASVSPSDFRHSRRFMDSAYLICGGLVNQICTASGKFGLASPLPDV